MVCFPQQYVLYFICEMLHALCYGCIMKVSSIVQTCEEHFAGSRVNTMSASTLSQGNEVLKASSSFSVIEKKMWHKEAHYSFVAYLLAVEQTEFYLWKICYFRVASTFNNLNLRLLWQLWIQFKAYFTSMLAQKMAEKFQCNPVYCEVSRSFRNEHWFVWVNGIAAKKSLLV